MNSKSKWRRNAKARLVIEKEGWEKKAEEEKEMDREKKRKRDYRRPKEDRRIKEIKETISERGCGKKEKRKVKL